MQEQNTDEKLLKPVLFVVRVMSDISKQDCIYNKRTHQCTKMRICIITNSLLNQLKPAPTATIYENTNLYRIYSTLVKMRFL